MKSLTSILVLLSASIAMAGPEQSPEAFSTSNCMGCHGQNGMGGLGPPIVKTKLTFPNFLKVVREGKGMMPATATKDMPDQKVEQVYNELLAMEWREDEIPVAYKVGQFLSTRNIGMIFFGVTIFAALAAIVNLRFWFRAAGFGYLWPRLVKMGLGKSLLVALKAFIVDGLFVRSLWQTNRKRWIMHGLILYGFLGLMFADMVIAAVNPQRSQFPLTHPLEFIPFLFGLAVILGLSYVMYRYKRDAYVDNGLTLGKDFLFVSLLFHAVVSGFLVVAMKRMGMHEWVMTIYIYHLATVVLLIATAPFTRFQHAWVVPTMVAFTRLGEAVVASGVDIGFEREPSPGRHHKSERIADNVMDQLGPEYSGKRRLRYYP